MEITCLTLTLMFILVGADRIRILSKGSIMLSCDDRDEKFEENRNLLVSSSIELFFFGQKEKSLDNYALSYPIFNCPILYMKIICLFLICCRVGNLTKKLIT